MIVFVLAGFFVFRNVSAWPARISYPGEESYEGCALAETTRLAEGVQIYAPPSSEGFAGATYGPLFFLVGSRLVDPSAHPMFRFACSRHWQSWAVQRGADFLVILAHRQPICGVA